jgi:transposase-like protein
MRRKQVIGDDQRRRSRAEAEQLVDAFEVSGMRRQEFCLKHGVVVGTLDFWRKRRREEQGAVASNPARMQNAAARARVANSGRLVAVEIAGTAISGKLAVVLPRGRRVEVSEGFDAATLERLLAVLEQA